MKTTTYTCLASDPESTSRWVWCLIDAPDGHAAKQLAAGTLGVSNPDHVSVFLDVPTDERDVIDSSISRFCGWKYVANVQPAKRAFVRLILKPGAELSWLRDNPDVLAFAESSPRSTGTFPAGSDGLSVDDFKPAPK